MGWKVLFGTVVWHIWKGRNNAVFNRSSYPHHTVFNNLLYDVHLIKCSWQGTRNDKQPLLTHRWMPPPRGLIKLNTDGSFKDITAASGGGAFRRDNGSWLKGFSIKVRVKKPIEAELLAIRHGLEMARELSLTNLILEVDAKAIVSMLNAVDQYLSHELGAIIHEVSNLIKELKVELCHIRRDFNVLAHLLSRHGMLMNEEIMVHTAVPEFAMKAFNNDYKGCNLVVQG